MSATQKDAIRHFCQQKGITEEQLADEINKAFEQPTGEELLHVLNKGAAIGRREMLDKACEWLEERQAVDLEVPNIEKFINDFKKAMEV